MPTDDKKKIRFTALSRVCAVALCIMLCGCAADAPEEDEPTEPSATPDMAVGDWYEPSDDYPWAEPGDAPPAPEGEPEGEQGGEPGEDSVIDVIEIPVSDSLLKSRASVLNIRSSPDQSSDDNIIGELAYEEQVEYLGMEGEFTHVRLMDGREAYCFSEFLVPAGAVLYAYPRAETGQKVNLATGQLEYSSEGAPVMVKSELVDLRLHLPGAQYELLFATERNVIGEPLYPRAIPLFQKDSLPKLQKAYETFLNDGYILKIYDAYRPYSVQKRLFAVVQNSHWIANPDTTASNHNRGCAVDIALIDAATGEELEFPTPMHTFAVESARTSDTWSDKQRENVDYMTRVMSECGFNHIESEWWHFADKSSSKYMTTDMNLGRLNMLPRQETDE